MVLAVSLNFSDFPVIVDLGYSRIVGLSDVFYVKVVVFVVHVIRSVLYEEEMTVVMEASDALDVFLPEVFSFEV